MFILNVLRDEVNFKLWLYEFRKEIHTDGIKNNLILVYLTKIVLMPLTRRRT